MEHLSSEKISSEEMAILDNNSEWLGIPKSYLMECAGYSFAIEIIKRYNLDDNFNLSSIEDPDEFMEKMKTISLNKQRANAVSILIDDNLLHEAESLLNLIDSKFSQGKKEVLAGYILALQGECNKSNEMFDRALVINPNVCIPDSYRKICK